MAAAIETVAEVGYVRASIGEIAKRAGLSSKGMISYHFDGKDDLMRAVVAEVLRVAHEFIQPRVAAAEGYVAALRARIESNIELIGEYPAHLRALLDILHNNVQPDLAGLDERTGRFEQHLRDGQRAGAYGEFEPAVLALALQGAIDAAVGTFTLAPPPGFDPVRYGRDLADVFVRAAGASA